jgi:Alternative complex III, ActD subunit
MRAQALYGIMAEFNRPEEVVVAARAARARGYRLMDAYTPFPVEGLAEELGFRFNWLPAIVLAGGVLGCVGGFAMQYYANVIGFPLNIGGRPNDSWPAFIPVTFELTILVAALFAALGMLALNRLPMPHHPLFNEPRFALASRNRFFICIEARDPRFDPDAVHDLLEGLGPIGVYEIEQSR